MRRGALILVLGLLAGCQNPEPPMGNLTVDEINARFAALPLPPYSLVDRIEAKLAGAPCIGRLDGWLREYSYVLRREFDRHAPVSHMIDTRYIEFHLYGSPPGKGKRWLSQPPGSLMNGPPNMKVAMGRYDRTTGKLLVSWCRGSEGSEAPPRTNLAL
jgi:hypothetical protein